MVKTVVGVIGVFIIIMTLCCGIYYFLDLNNDNRKNIFSKYKIKEFDKHPIIFLFLAIITGMFIGFMILFIAI